MLQRSPNLLYYVGLFLISSSVFYFLLLLSGLLWSWIITPLMFVLWLVAPALIVAYLFFRDQHRKPAASELYILAMVCTVCGLMIPLAGQFFMASIWFSNAGTGNFFAYTISTWFWAGVVILGCISYFWFLVFVWGWLFVKLGKE